MRSRPWKAGVGFVLVVALRAAAGPATSALCATLSPTTLPATTLPDVAATTAPATAPSTQPADLSTPKGALRLFARALHEGNADKLSEAIQASSPAEQHMVSAMADMAGALEGLHDAVARQFGEPAAAHFTGDTQAQLQQSLERIEQAEVTVEGDRATVRYPGDASAQYELRRVGGNWKIPAEQFAHGAASEVLARRVAESAAQTTLVREVTWEIQAGKYKTAEAAADAWRSRMMQSLAGPLTTSPTTRPQPGKEH